MNASFSNNVSRVAAALDEIDVKGTAFYKVPDGKRYYENMTLEERAVLLGAPSAAHLCKTLLLSTTGGRFDEDMEAEEEGEGEDDPNDQFVLLVVPYNARVDASKLKSALKGKNLIPENVKKSVCVASAKRSERVLGFPHNGVSVVGGKSKRDIPIVVAESVAKLFPPVVYLGGGEQDVKLVLPDIHDFVMKAKAFVLNVTEPRVEGVVKAKPTAHAVVAAVPAVAAAAAPAAPAPPTVTPPAKSESSPAKGTKRDKAAATGEGNNASDETGGGKKAPAPPPAPASFDDLEVLVGIVTKAWKHPDSEKLMCEEIDIGEATGPRQIASGIQAHYTPEDFAGKRVCVVANLKPAKLGGFTSNGMVLCASWTDAATSKYTVRLINPPANAAIGSRVVVGPSPYRTPAAASLVKNKKIFESVAEKLRLDDSGAHVMFDGVPVAVADEPCTVDGGAGIPRAQVS